MIKEDKRTVTLFLDNLDRQVRDLKDHEARLPFARKDDRQEIRRIWGELEFMSNELRDHVERL